MSSKQKNRTLFHLSIIAFLVILLASFGFFKTQKNPELGEILPKPFDYKFAYDSGDGNVTIYDLEKDSTSSATLNTKGLSQISWSIDNKLAAEDTNGNIYFIDTSNNQSKKVLTNLGYFFWSADTSKIISGNFMGDERIIGGHIRKMFSVDVDGAVTPIKKADYDLYYKGNAENIERLASFDGNYFYNSWVDDNDYRSELTYTPTGKKYSLAQFTPVSNACLSAGNTYIGINSQGNNNFSVYKFDDIMRGDVTKAVFTSSEVRDFGFIDDSHLIYIVSLVNDAKQTSFNHTFYYLDLNTGQAKELYAIVDNDQANIDLYITPDGQHFAYTLWDEKQKNRTYKDEIVVANISDGQTVKKIEFKTGAWSNPIKN